MQNKTRIVASALVAAVLLTGATVGCSKRKNNTNDAADSAKITRGSAAGTTRSGGTRVAVDVNPEDIIPPDITGEVPPIKVSVDEDGTTYINDIPAKPDEFREIVEKIARDYKTAEATYDTLPPEAESFLATSAPAEKTNAPSDPENPDVPDDPEPPSPDAVLLASYTKTGNTALAIGAVYLYSNDRPGAIMRDTYSPEETAIVNVECAAGGVSGGALCIVPHDTPHAGDYSDSDCLVRMSFAEGVPSGDNIAFIFRMPNAYGLYDIRFTCGGAEEGYITVMLG